MEQLNNILTVTEVASQLKVTPQYVRKLISEKKLNGIRIGNQWVVEQANLSNYINKYKNNASVIIVIDEVQQNKNIDNFIGDDYSVETIYNVNINEENGNIKINFNTSN